MVMLSSVVIHLARKKKHQVNENNSQHSQTKIKE